MIKFVKILFLCCTIITVILLIFILIFIETLKDIVLDENVEWLPWNQLYPIIEEIPSDWMVEGPLTDNMDNECHFCDPNIFTDLLKAKVS